MFSLAVKIGCVIAFILSVIGTLFAETKIIKGTKEIQSSDPSLYDMMFLGLSLIEILPILSLILMIIVFLKY
jgi:F0F1-type ATP synthase membrane subunit c/vacuolar-type H+-ATPase subunit K